MLGEGPVHLQYLEGLEGTYYLANRKNTMFQVDKRGLDGVAEAKLTPEEARANDRRRSRPRRPRDSCCVVCL